MEIVIPSKEQKMPEKDKDKVTVKKLFLVKKGVIVKPKPKKGESVKRSENTEKKGSNWSRWTWSDN